VSASRRVQAEPHAPECFGLKATRRGPPGKVPSPGVLSDPRRGLYCKNAALGDGGVTLQTASQQLPEPGKPPCAVQRLLLDFTLHRVCPGHVASLAHAAPPSWQNPLMHFPGEAKQQVTNPVFFPHVERAAHRVTVPLQLVGSPFATASRTACATQLT